MKKQKATLDDVTEVFFEASSSAALAMYQKVGKIPLALSALVKEGKDYKLVPINSGGLLDVEPRMAQVTIDSMLKPLITYTNEKGHKKARPVVFFLSIEADGVIRAGEKKEQAKIVINAARKEDKKGRTSVFKFVGDGFMNLTEPENNVWVEKPEEAEDGVSSMVQPMLDIVWRSYAVGKNMSLLV